MGKRLLLLTEDVEDLKDDLSELQINDIFFFGDYHGEIEWKVLEKDSEYLLAISEYGLDAKPFDKEGDTNSWNNCSLKKWLNSEFFNKAFDPEEKSLIESFDIGKVFLLSENEAKKYFKSDSDRKCKPTQYAKSQGAYIKNGFTWWWLRTQHFTGLSVKCINISGDIGYDYVGNAKVSVRPCIIIKIK